ncbi:HU family DNA-binding protein [uncultured Roseovarius sp.]|uniref:HU family DNA-binding protein n=1 Tax=uncultured Roseovarius sp. TaxID=293344 RepID=UPI0026185EA8|nr:HU family DNA-binding protein [uncultured Roseovarius sp.]
MKTKTTTAKSSRSTSTRSGKSTTPNVSPAVASPGNPSGPSANGAASSITPVIVSDTVPDDAGPEMKKQELLSKVLERVETKKKFAKPVVEAVLEVLGNALADGRELNLEPLGKVKQNRVRDAANAHIIIAKIRQPKKSGKASENAETRELNSGVKDEVAEPNE